MPFSSLHLERRWEQRVRPESRISSACALCTAENYSHTGEHCARPVLMRTVLQWDVGENWEPPGIWTMCVLAFLFFQAGGVAPPCFPAARRWIILYTLNWRKFKDLLVPSAYTSSCLHQFKNLQFRIALKLSGHLWIIIVLVCVMVLSSRKSLLAKTSSKCLMHTEVAAAAFKRPPPPPPPCQGSSQQGFHFVHHHHLPGCISIVRGRITAPRHWKDSSKHIIWEESTAWIYIFLISLQAQLILKSAIQMLMKKK